MQSLAIVLSLYQLEGQNACKPVKVNVQVHPGLKSPPDRDLKSGARSWVRASLHPAKPATGVKGEAKFVPKYECFAKAKPASYPNEDGGAPAFGERAR